MSVSLVFSLTWRATLTWRLARQARAYRVRMQFRGPVDSSMEDVYLAALRGQYHTDSVRLDRKRGDVQFAEFLHVVREHFIAKLHKDIRVQVRSSFGPQ